MHRTRIQVGRAQAGGLSLLLAVALLAAAGSGVETARRMAVAGAGLAYAMVADVPTPAPEAAAPGAQRALVGVTSPARTASPAEPVSVRGLACELVVSGCIDLPPPSFAA